MNECHSVLIIAPRGMVTEDKNGCDVEYNVHFLLQMHWDGKEGERLEGSLVGFRCPCPRPGD